MKALHTTCITLAVALSATACDYFSKSKELSARKIQENSSTESSELATASPSKIQSTIKMEDSLCEKLLTALPNEPYFYQFQANLRAYKENELAGHLIQSHMRYRNLIDTKSSPSDKSYQRYQDCAESILKIDRFQDVLALKKQMNQEIPVQLPAH